jgi:hypothetical protein
MLSNDYGVDTYAGTERFAASPGSQFAFVFVSVSDSEGDSLYFPGDELKMVVGDRSYTPATMGTRGDFEYPATGAAYAQYSGDGWVMYEIPDKTRKEEISLSIQWENIGGGPWAIRWE